MNTLDRLTYSIEYHANTQLWSVNNSGTPIKWYKTKEEAQNHVIRILEFNYESISK